MDDAELEARLFARDEAPPDTSRPVPDWRTVHRELRRKGFTLQLLHMEYKERHPDGYQYTQSCRHYRAWQGRLDLVMRQEHRAGEKPFVDFPGMTIPIVDPDSGEVWQAEAAPARRLPRAAAGTERQGRRAGGCPCRSTPCCAVLRRMPNPDDGPGVR